MTVARAHAGRAYPLAAALALIALLLSTGLHLPHLAMAGGHGDSEPGHQAAQVSVRPEFGGDEHPVALTTDPGCHALPCMAPARLDGADAPQADAWPGYSAAPPPGLQLTLPAAPALPWASVASRLAILQQYRL